MEGEDPTFQEVYDLGNVIGRFAITFTICHGFCWKTKVRLNKVKQRVFIFSGTFCEVRQCVHIDSGQLFSVKIVDYEKLSAVSSFSYEGL